MAIFYEWIRRFWGSLHGGRRDADLEEELRLHLELATDGARRQGHSFDEATRRARFEAGGLAQAMEAARDQRGLPWLQDMLGDGRIALRMMRRSPIFSIVAIVSLGLGIGANTAIFSLLNTLILRPLPVHEPDRLVEVLSQYPGEPRTNGYSWKVFEHFRDQNHVFSDLFALSPALMQLGDAGAAAPVTGEYVTENFFSALGVTPAIGRLIGPLDHEPGATPVVVVSWQLWHDRFNLNPSVLGRQLVVNGMPATIVGVAPKSYRGLLVGYHPELWLPLAAEKRGERSPLLSVMARLKSGVAIEQARAEMQLLDRFRVELLAQRSPNLRRLTIDLEPASSGFAAVRDRFGKAVLAVAAIVGLLLLVACTNVAGVLLARASARHREMALRVSVGASRWRLVRQMIAESLLLATAGGMLGIVVAYIGVTTLVGILASGRDIVGFVGPVQLDARLDTEALLFTTVVALAAGVLFGFAPAWHAFASAPAAALRATGTAGESRSKGSFGKGLIVAQVSISMVLLAAAALFANHLSNLRTVGLGFDRESVLLLTIEPSRTGYTPEQLSVPYQDLLARIGVLPYVHSVTLSAVTPIQGAGVKRFVDMVGVQESADRSRTLLNWVAPKYFNTFGTPLIEGRDFSFDDAQQPAVSIVNQAVAQYYFGDGSAIGRRFTLEGQSRPYEIVGVVADAKYLTLHEQAPRTVYLNVAQEPRVFANRLSIRTETTPTAVADDVRRLVEEVFKPGAVASITTLEDQVDAEIVPERMLAVLSGMFGVLGAALAGLGLYGLLAYTVSRRTNEIGVRIALGAAPKSVVAAVVRNAIGMVLVGLVIGVPIAVAGQRVVAGLVSNVSVGGPTAIALAAAAMMLVALISAFLPARRAALVDPVVALRTD